MKLHLVNKIKLSLEDRHFSELIKKGATALMFRLIGAVLAFLFTVYLARLLGAGDYGFFALSLTIVTALSVVVRLGLDVVVMKNVAAAVEHENLDLARGYLQSAIQIVLILGAGVTIIGVLTAPVISTFVFSKPELSSPLGQMIWLLVPLSISMLHVEALKGLKSISDFIIVQNIMVPGLSLVVLILGSCCHAWNLNQAIAVYVISTLGAAYYASLRWKKTILPGSSIKLSRVNLIKTGFHFLLVTSGSLIMAWTDILVLGIYENIEVVGIYTVASKTALLTSIILFATNAIAAPKFAAFYAKNNLKAMARLARQSTLLMVCAVCMPATLFFVWPEEILGFYGSEYKAGATALTILTFGQIINVSCGSVAYLLMVSGHEKVVRNVVFVAASINIVLNVSLVQLYGIRGVAIATMLSVAILNIWMLISVKKHLGFWTMYNSN